MHTNEWKIVKEVNNRAQKKIWFLLWYHDSLFSSRNYQKPHVWGVFREDLLCSKDVTRQLQYGFSVR